MIHGPPRHPAARCMSLVYPVPSRVAWRPGDQHSSPLGSEPPDRAGDSASRGRAVPAFVGNGAITAMPAARTGQKFIAEDAGRRAVQWRPPAPARNMPVRPGPHSVSSLPRRSGISGGGAATRSHARTMPPRQVRGEAICRVPRPGRGWGGPPLPRKDRRSRSPPGAGARVGPLPSRALPPGRPQGKAARGARNPLPRSNDAPSDR